MPKKHYCQDIHTSSAAFNAYGSFTVYILKPCHFSKSWEKTESWKLKYSLNNLELKQKNVGKERMLLFHIKCNNI